MMLSNKDKAIIKENLKITNQRISAAAKRSGRSEGDIMLLAVSKDFHVEAIEGVI